jgi:hypothetical protein
LDHILNYTGPAAGTARLLRGRRRTSRPGRPTIRKADLGIAHLPGRSTARLGTNIYITSHGHRARPDRFGVATGDVGEHITQLVRGPLLLLTDQTLQQKLDSTTGDRTVPPDSPASSPRHCELAMR